MANQHPDDVIFIKKANTGTNSTEVHILSAQQGYRGWSLQTGSALHVTDNNWEFLLAPNRDIFCVKKANTSTNR
jgi:hypothetical protein